MWKVNQSVGSEELVPFWVHFVLLHLVLGLWQRACEGGGEWVRTGQCIYIYVLGPEAGTGERHRTSLSD